MPVRQANKTTINAQRKFIGATSAFSPAFQISGEKTTPIPAIAAS
jgi:hypothetical protein